MGCGGGRSAFVGGCASGFVGGAGGGKFGRRLLKEEKISVKRQGGVRNQMQRLTFGVACTLVMSLAI